MAAKKRKERRRLWNIEPYTYQSTVVRKEKERPLCAGPDVLTRQPLLSHFRLLRDDFFFFASVEETAHPFENRLRPPTLCFSVHLSVS